MILTNLQKESVLQIVEHYNNGTRKVDFKAPTGSGKTLMAINVLSTIMNQHPEDKFIFIIATLSSADLPRAFEEKINLYKGDLDYNDFEVEYIESPSSSKNNKKDVQVQLKPTPNKIFIFGKATFGKNRIITEQNIIADFIQECKSQDYKIIYVRDEAHIGTKGINKKDSKNFEELMENNANFILKMTATLDFKDTSTRKVVLKEKDLIDSSRNEGKYLIKTKLKLLKAPNLDDNKILKQAIDTFKKIKEEYSSLTNCIIRPAMLIQVDNEPDDPIKKEAYFNGLNMIKKELDSANLSWVQYFGNSKEYSNVDNANFTLSKITRNNDTTDCIIFKIGPSTGWDIPRACMLLQLRDVCSESLRTQTIGRIKRNPYPTLERNEITDVYYLFSNEDSEKEKNIVVSELNLKKNYEKEEFVSVEVHIKDEYFNKNNVDKLVQKFLEKNRYFISQQINTCFQDNVYIDEKNKRCISCPIVLLKLLEIEKRSLNEKEKIFLEHVQNKLKFVENLKNFKVETVLIVLLTYFKQKIDAIIKESISKHLSYELVEKVIEPNVYINLYDGIDEDKCKNITDNYLFDIKRDYKIDNRAILDSSNETKIWDKIETYMEVDDTIKVWAKNQTSGNLYGEYLDGTSTTRKSYFDFVIKFKNGNLLYIEVKGDEDNDIDREKTRKLKQAYEDYFKNPMNTGLFSKKFVICIAAVGVDREVKLSCFYDKDIIAADLNTLNLSRLLRTLAEN